MNGLARHTIIRALELALSPGRFVAKIGLGTRLTLNVLVFYFEETLFGFS